MIPAGGSQHGWTRTRAYEWALTRPSTALLGASHWISHNLAVRFQGARRLLDKRTAHSLPNAMGPLPGSLPIQSSPSRTIQGQVPSSSGPECGPKWGMRQQLAGQDSGIRRVTDRAQSQGSEVHESKSHYVQRQLQVFHDESIIQAVCFSLAVCMTSVHVFYHPSLLTYSSRGSPSIRPKNLSALTYM